MKNQFFKFRKSGTWVAPSYLDVFVISMFRYTWRYMGAALFYHQNYTANV